MSLKNDIEKIAKKIEDLIKADISSKGLVDTGRLLNSIQAVVAIKKNNEFDIQFLTEDYFKYVDGKHNILSDVTNSSEFKAIEEEITQAIMDAYEDELDKIFNKNKHLK